MDEASIRHRLQQRMKTKQQENQPEDMSDMVRDHLNHSAKKRKAKEARGDEKRRKDFKF